MGFDGWAGQVARCAACLFAPRVWDAGGQVMRDTYSKWDNGAAICRNVLGRFIWDPICHCTAVAWQDGMQGRGNNAGCALKMAHFLPAQRWVAAWGCVLRVLRAMQGGIMLKTHVLPANAANGGAHGAALCGCHIGGSVPVQFCVLCPEGQRTEAFLPGRFGIHMVFGKPLPFVAGM